MILCVRKGFMEHWNASIGLLRAQMELLRHRQHGVSSEKIDWKIEQCELMFDEIEASRAEADVRSGKGLLPDRDNAPRQAQTQTSAGWHEGGRQIVQVEVDSGVAEWRGKNLAARAVTDELAALLMTIVSAIDLIVARSWVLRC